MVTTTNRIADIFADARAVHADALRLLEAGDFPNAAERAWHTIRLATDALILARTGVEPVIPSERSKGIGRLATDDDAVLPLHKRYHIALAYLYGTCFSLGVCEPKDEVESLIRQTADYIADAERLAGYPNAA